ncbi:MAG: Fic family protein, partial [Nitrospinae bacterium]|nr:Fic family protein [Nitrospinota bacterium]
PAIGEGWAKKPDYAFFIDDNTLKSARNKLKSGGYFSAALCIGEAKKWGRPLDRLKSALSEIEGTETDPFEMQNPSLQMSRYLWITGVKWGILTDGRFWRLYERETSKKLDIYYEVDLEDLMINGSLEDFKYFYLFFRADAFPAFLDKVYNGSVDYAKEVGDELKENVYKALKILSEGYLKTQGNQLFPQNLNEIHDNSLIFLYRLLFILYAESRELLPLNENKLYTESYSLDSLKKEIANSFEHNETIPVSTFHYWNKLKELFDRINNGNKELDVPPYNGGLFNPEKHSFLEKNRVGDFYIAKAIDLLSRTNDRAYIDYGSLEIRHLGSIYEGLLEYKLKIAEEDLYPVKEKGKEIYIPINQAKTRSKKINTDTIVNAGEIYLVTDKGERKATGSYYTPDYVVEYIVENTLCPVIEIKKKDIAEKISGLKEKIKTSRGINREIYQKELKKIKNSFIDELLSIKVLDPAMGSGHFLVEAVDFLAHELIKLMSGEPLEKAEVSVVKEEIPDYGQKKSGEDDIRWARREVVEKCIFGVDLNPLAVELAKLSLWLHTVAKNRPLNFLDHHLRCGNSLTGARVEDLADLPELKKKKTIEGAPKQLGLFESIFKEKVNILLGAFAQIEGLPSDTVEQIQEKEKLYENFRRIVSRFQDIADIWTSVYFGNGIDFGKYHNLQDNLRANDTAWENLKNEPWFKKAKAIAQAKGFFHWELEFPEIFFEGHQRKKNQGFDCVIGNPPYERTKYLIDEQVFLEQAYETCYGAYDIYVPFIELSNKLINQNGHFGFITSNKYLVADYGSKLREFLLNRVSIVQLIDLTEAHSTFKEALVSPLITITKKGTCKQTKIAILNIDNLELLKEIGSIGEKGKGYIESKDFIVEFRPIGELQDSISGHFNIYLAGKKKELVNTIYSNSDLLKDVADIRTGIMGFNYWNVSSLIKDSPTIKSDEVKIYPPSLIERYDMLWGIEIVNLYKKEYLFPVIHYDPKQIDTNTWQLFKAQKVVVRGVARHLSATLDTEGCGILVAVHSVIPKNLSLSFVVAILNSNLCNWLHILKFYSARIPQGSLRYPVSFYEQLPIPHISFTTPEKERKRRLEEFKGLYNNYLESLASNSDLCQNKKYERSGENIQSGRTSTEFKKVAGKPQGYKLPPEGLSGEGSGLGREVHGVREGGGGYKSSEGTPEEGKDSTRPLDSTRYFETALGIKSYSEVSEIIAVSVTKVIERIIVGLPEEIKVIPEWICSLHKDIAGSLFPVWAGRFRDINVEVGQHTPPPFYEVPVNMRLYCDDLAVRITNAEKKRDIKEIAELLAWLDWRFQWIHPFKDFNGRVGRILLTAILFRLKLPPAETASVEPEEREEYLKALRSADNGDLSALIQIWIERLRKSIQRGEE